uniref:Bacterial toxin 44 domain-containing protein n=2 Tax=Pseudoalteromonas rubra TaxID=43658 RepID=A0A0F4QS17_9GAMM|nr:hypothetical protein TW77_07280 [Pseudoalteromonas rubra]
MFNDEMEHGKKKAQVPERFQEVLETAGIDLELNIAEAESMSFEKWEAAVKTGGKWDYKNSLTDYDFSPELLDDFGNFHFGVVAAAYGFNLEGSMFGAGANQVLRQGGGTPRQLHLAIPILAYSGGGYLLPDFVSRTATNFGFSWGDNPGDSINIMNGWDYYHDSR